MDKKYTINFNEKNIENWHLTNDDIMGGKSQSEIIYDEDKHIFSGIISKENNGGFSSIYQNIKQLSSGLNKVKLDLIGDGLTYQIRVYVLIDGYRLAYKHDFQTCAGKRQSLVFSLNDFTATYRGQTLSGRGAVKSQDIIQTGILITNEKPIGFTLKLLNLSFYKT